MRLNYPVFSAFVLYLSIAQFLLTFGAFGAVDTNDDHRAITEVVERLGTSYMAKDIEGYMSTFWPDDFLYKSDVATPADPTDDVVISDINEERRLTEWVFSEFAEIKLDFWRDLISYLWKDKATVRNYYEFVAEGKEETEQGVVAAGMNEFRLQKREMPDGGSHWRITQWTQFEWPSWAVGLLSDAYRYSGSRDYPERRNILSELISTRVEVEYRPVEASDIQKALEGGEDIRLEQVKVEGDIEFGGKVEQAVSINNSLFLGSVDFKNSTFKSGLSFSGSVFAERTDFSNSNFSGEADFSGCIFFSSSTYWGAKFSQDAGFVNSVFSRWADFSNTIFSARAIFSNAIFLDDANYYSSRFQADSYFQFADFRGDISFHSCLFEGKCHFLKAMYPESEEMDFQEVTYTGQVMVDWAPEYVNFVGSGGRMGFGGHEVSEFARRNPGLKFISSTRLHPVNSYMDETITDWISSRYGLRGRLKYDEPVYIALIENYRELGWLNEADDAYYTYRVEKRERKVEKRKRREEYKEGPINPWYARFLEYVILDFSFGYGVKPGKLLRSFLMLWMPFSLYYALCLHYKPHDRLSYRMRYRQRPVRRLLFKGYDKLRRFLWGVLHSFDTITLGIDLHSLKSLEQSPYFLNERSKWILWAQRTQKLLGWYLLALFLVMFGKIWVR